MRRINVIINEDLYRKAKAVAFLRNKSLSEIIRSSLDEWIQKRMGKREELILSAKDEKEILDILASDEFLTSEELKKSLGL
jgi:Arc/MetJ-type ribon-helix-helix transcriptional regulator